MVPIIPLCLIPFMTNSYISKHKVSDGTTEPAAKTSASKTTVEEKPANSVVPFPGKTATTMLFALMGLYFMMTYGTEVVSYYLPFSMEYYHLDTSDVGVATAMFFLAATISGFLLTYVITWLKRSTMQVAIMLCVIGLLFVATVHSYWAYVVGVFVMGLGYGVVQPVIYDKTSYVAPTKEKSTEYFAYLLTCNYVGISVVPFIISGAKKLFEATNDVNFSFMFNGCVLAIVLIIAIWKRRSFVFEADPKFYTELNPPIPGLAEEKKLN